MFEAALLTELKRDTELTGYLSEYKGEPSIFSENAPEGAGQMFIVFSIQSTANDFMGIELFTIFVDIYNFNNSWSDCRKAANRVKNWLDTKTLNSDRYDHIRISFFSGSPVPGPDPRDIHYNLQFSARASRKEWMEHNL